MVIPIHDFMPKTAMCRLERRLFGRIHGQLQKRPGKALKRRYRLERDLFRRIHDQQLERKEG